MGWVTDKGKDTVQKFKDGGEIDEYTLKSGIAEMEKEKGKDWDKKLTAKDVAWEDASIEEIRKAKRDARKHIRKMKRTGIKKIRQEAKETRKSGEQVNFGDTFKKVREERKRKRKVIKAINRVSAGFDEEGYRRDADKADIEKHKKKKNKK